MRSRTVTLLVALGLGMPIAPSCAVRQGDLVPSASQPSEVNVLFRPVAGIRLAYETVSSFKGLDASGKRVAGSSTRKLVVEVITKDEDGYGIRLTVDGRMAPATFRVSSRGTLLKVLFDHSGPPSSQEAYALGSATARLVQLSVVHDGPWKRDETRPLGFSLPPSLEQFEAILKRILAGSVTFRRLVTVEGRPAVEFDYTKTMDFRLLGLEGIGQMSGPLWVDGKTGILLRSTGKLARSWSAGGRMVSGEMIAEEMLVIEDSSGL